MFLAWTTLVLVCSFLQQLTSAIDPIYDADPDVGMSNVNVKILNANNYNIHHSGFCFVVFLGVFF